MGKVIDIKSLHEEAKEKSLLDIGTLCLFSDDKTLALDKINDSDLLFDYLEDINSGKVRRRYRSNKGVDWAYAIPVELLLSCGSNTSEDLVLDILSDFTNQGFIPKVFTENLTLALSRSKGVHSNIYRVELDGVNTLCELLFKTYSSNKSLIKYINTGFEELVDSSELLKICTHFDFVYALPWVFDEDVSEELKDNIKGLLSDQLRGLFDQKVLDSDDAMF
jgi:hypothetical protein